MKLLCELNLYVEYSRFVVKKGENLEVIQVLKTDYIPEPSLKGNLLEAESLGQTLSISFLPHPYSYTSFFLCICMF